MQVKQRERAKASAPGRKGSSKKGSGRKEVEYNRKETEEKR